MLKKKRWILLFFLLLKNSIDASETLSLPFSCLLGIGFEEVNTHYANAIFSQNNEHIKFLLFQAESSCRRRDFFLSFWADYGIFGRGEVENTLQLQFLPTKGFLADGGFTLGYFVPLTPDHLAVTSLIPEGGYSGYWLHLRTTLTHYKELWYGPFFGGSLQIENPQGFIVLLRYHYHWFTFSQALSTLRVTMKSHHSYGHEAELKLQTYLFQNIMLGAALHYLYYRKTSSDVFSAQREDLSISLQWSYLF